MLTLCAILLSLQRNVHILFAEYLFSNENPPTTKWIYDENGILVVLCIHIGKYLKAVYSHEESPLHTGKIFCGLQSISVHFAVMQSD